MLLNYWINFLRAQHVAFYMSQIDEATFMSWREQGIAGVANLPGC